LKGEVMFAHQVIEELTRTANSLSEMGIVNDYSKHISATIPIIRKSIKFHISDENEMLYFRKSAFGKEAVFMEMANYIKLPYPNIYVDYICDDSKAEEKVRVAKIAATMSAFKDNILRVNFMAFSEHHQRWFLAPQSYIIKVGGFLDSKTSSNIAMVSAYPFTDGEKDKIIKEDTSDLVILNSFLLLLNCKNVITDKVPAPEALNKKRRKAGKQEIFDYHVLNVVVPSSKREYREATIPLSHNRVHLCRGHFKEYTAEHPLFGKYTGLYWWQPHVRGQNKDGIVMKDYRVSNKETP